MLTRSFVKTNIISFSILLFLIMYFFINNLKPAFLYKKNGQLRSFGLNYSGKTVIPLWVIVIALSSLSYLAVLYWINYPRLN